MQVQVRFFSLFRERAGAKEALLDLAPGTTVGQALAEVARRHPSLGAFLDGHRDLLLVSVNREYVSSDATLRDGDELALFPPVSGGSPARVGLLLLSGGFDSPVAGHFAQSQGDRLEAVHFTMEPFTDDASARKSTRLAAFLGIPRLNVVPIGAQLAVFTQSCKHAYYFVLQKRFMVRLATHLADRLGASFLVTGENLGQVSSQTLVNLGTIDAASTLPILRPLLGLDKSDIIARARALGTYETSRGPEVCDVLGPRHPSTSAAVDRVLVEEARVDLGALERDALASAFSVDTGLDYARPERRVLNAASGPAPAACD